MDCLSCGTAMNVDYYYKCYTKCVIVLIKKAVKWTAAAYFAMAAVKDCGYGILLKPHYLTDLVLTDYHPFPQ